MPRNSGESITNGSLTFGTSAAIWNTESSAFGITNGKYYFEVKLKDNGSDRRFRWGLQKNAEITKTGNNKVIGGTDNNAIGYKTQGETATQGGYFINQTSTNMSDGDINENNAIYGFAIDLDNQRMYGHFNGTWFHSGNPSAGSGGLDVSSFYTVGEPLFPSFLIALTLLAINIIVVGFVQPYSKYAYEELIFDVRSGALGAAIKSNEFTNLGEGLTLRIEESRNSGRELIDIFAQKEDADGHIFSVSAKSGNFFASPDQKYIILRLYEGSLIDFDASQDRPRILNFDMHDLPLEVPMFEQFRNRGDEAAEMTFENVVKSSIFCQKQNRFLCKNHFLKFQLNSETFKCK